MLPLPDRVTKPINKAAWSSINSACGKNFRHSQYNNSSKTSLPNPLNYFICNKRLLITKENRSYVGESVGGFFISLIHLDVNMYFFTTIRKCLRFFARIHFLCKAPKYCDIAIRIIGCTDNIGSLETNQTLSEVLANAIKNE